MSPIQSLFVVFSFECWVWAERTDDVYTAISELEPLLKTNERVISDLSDYIVKTERRTSLLIKYLNKLKNEHERASKNKLIYIQNPINAFKLIRGLTTDLKDIEDIILAGAEDSQNRFRHTDMRYPTFKDLFGAAKAIARIQTTYKLSPNDLEQSVFNETDNIVGSSRLTTNEYYDLSYMLYSAYKYEHALSWMLQALRSYESGDKGEDGFTKAEIVEFIARCYYLLKDDFKSIEWMKKVLIANPWHKRAPPYITYLMFKVANQCKPSEAPEESIQSAEEESNDTIELNYKPLCRGEFEISREVSKKLYCRYSARNHPFMKLAPIKMEQLYEQPDVYMFYDVLTEAEIEMLKNYSLKQLERSCLDTDEPLTEVDYRISKGAWVADSYSQAVAKVSQRVSDLTGLNVTWAEEFHIINYGIGGHYEPHFDFATKAEGGIFPNDTTGNRIATFLIYMTDVERGGATVFPNLGLTVFPIRNAALYWDNLHSSGEGDNATLHGACPVLYGSKWVVTKWIRQEGQELIRPCKLEYEDEGFSRDIPKPLRRQSTF